MYIFYIYIHTYAYIKYIVCKTLMKFILSRRVWNGTKHNYSVGSVGGTAEVGRDEGLMSETHITSLVPPSVPSHESRLLVTLQMAV